ncbi:MAG TPA: hypothetical protein VFH55_12550 [Nitrospiria bacterium]|nr:hypothetical protein [Nitrospiria bacterium]
MQPCRLSDPKCLGSMHRPVPSLLELGSSILIEASNDLNPIAESFLHRTVIDRL